ncbi:MAG TPA: hypothetical protein VK586_19360, partial [Streptosporangiaceae bacterium]|nr:hypothetical protein [Streptosporangiaceae bacterium]
VLGALMPGELVVPVPMVNAGEVDHLRGRLPGFAAGGVVSSYSGAVPGLAPWMGRQELATQAMLEKLTAAAATAALKAAPVLGASSSVGVSAARTGSVAVEENFARRLLAQYGWAASQMNSLIPLWMRESGWNPYAVNPSSGAYGIPQSLGHGHPYNLGDYQNQIIWGLNYIKGRYGSPAAAEGHEQAFGWYDKGGYLPPGMSVAYNGTGRPEHVSTQADMAGVIAELKGLRADHDALRRELVAAVGKVAPATAAGVSRSLDGLARGVVTR